MNKNYIKILEKITNNGYQAYVVGGYVRDKLIGIKNIDIDIITDAKPEELKQIFKKSVIKTYDNYGGTKIKQNKQTIDITTFRKEISYKNGKPNIIEYTKNLEEDLLRRDFTINTICMDKNEKIIDLYNAKKDIEDKLIKTVKDTNKSFKEDPSRILRAIRLMSELNFKLSEEIKKYIINNKGEIKKISNYKIKEEIEKLFQTKKTKTFLKYIKENELEEYIGIKSNNFKETTNKLGEWSQLEISKKIPFTKSEQKIINEIKELLNKKNIDQYDIYKKGKDVCIIAAEILKINKNKINFFYTNLPIKGIIDIDIKSEEICEYLKIKPNKELGKIIKRIEYEIIMGNLKNNKKEILKKLEELR